MQTVFKIIHRLVQVECVFFGGWVILAGSMLLTTEVQFDLILPLVGVVLSLVSLMACEIIISFVKPTDPPVV